MDDNDTCWCPTCDRQILPKRYQVPVLQNDLLPPPPPSSPVRRSTKNSRQQRGGLVQGTGRVNPNGALKQQKQQPVKLRTVIDQGPTPLYCSDECQRAEINRGLPHNFNPNSHKSSSSVSISPGTLDSTSSAPSSSLDSQSSVESNTSRPELSPSMATLAAIYNFPPLPPPPPIDFDPVPPRPAAPPLETGVIMAARRINETLCAKQPQKRDSYGRVVPSTEPRKPIPGWTDGSNAWRSSVYSLTAPNSSSSPAPHKSFATRRSSGVQSTLTANASYPTTSSSLPTYPGSESDAELLTRFSQSFRRTSSPLSPPLSSSSCSGSFPMTPPPQKRERPLVQPGAEGKLLVPQVMMRVNTGGSSASPSRSSFNRRSTRSPLSQASSSGDEDDSTQRCGSVSSLPHAPKRPTVETRSWSYDNVKTYPAMRLPPKKRIEKHLEKRIVDGEEVEVEVEVEVIVEEKRKRLFLFPAPLTALPTGA